MALPVARRARVGARALDLALASLYLVLGGLLAYLVLLDQGAAVTAILGATDSHRNYLTSSSTTVATSQTLRALSGCGSG